MNKLILITFLGFLSFVSNSQDLTFPAWEDTVHGTTEDWLITSHEKDVINTSGVVLSLKVKKNQLVTVNSTEYYFCWGPTCQTSTDTISSEIVTIAVNDTNGSFISYAKVKSLGENAGVSNIEYCFSETGNLISDFCVSQYFDVSYISAINEEKVTRKPAEFKLTSFANTILITLEKDSRDAQVNLYDTQGRFVASQSALNASAISLSTVGLPAGNYIINVQDENVIIGSKQIILLQ